MNKGWIKLYRDITDWKWWSAPNTAHLYVHLILTANIEDKEWRDIIVERGSLVTSINSLSLATGLSVQSIRTSLRRLESTGDIKKKSTSEWTMITICNYDSYQDSDYQSNKPTTNQQHTNNNNYRIEEYKNIKKENNIKEKKVFRKPSVAEVTEYCQQLHNGIDAEHFVAFYESKGWVVGKSPMKDWKAAVRTWEQTRKNKPMPITTDNGITLGDGEWVRPDGTRTYGSGRVTVPPTAPPRPNQYCTWSSGDNQWIM